MPEIVHACGKKLRFPDGSEGRKGKCPSCGGPVEVPRVSPAAEPELIGEIVPESAIVAAPPPPPPTVSDGAPKKRTGLTPVLRLKESGETKARIELEPPANWDQYQAFLDGRGPAPRSFVMPANLMLKTEADAQWKRAEDQGPPSKYKCPGCQKTIHVGDIIRLGCGVDFRLGRTLDGEKQLTDAGRKYLAAIPWLKDLPPPDESGDDDDDDDKAPSDAQKKLASKLGKKKRRRPR